MPQKVIIDGVEKEVFTKEEMDAKEKELGEANTKAIEEASTKSAESAIKKFQEEHPDQTAELEKAKTDLEESQKKLDEAEGGGEGENKDGDDPQIKRLREERDEAQRIMSEGMEQFQKDLSEIKNTLVGDTKEDLLKKFAGEDKDLRDKIEFHFDSFKDDAVTKEQITARMESSFTLATGQKPTPEALDNLSKSDEKGDGGSEDKKEHVPTQNEKNIGKVLGISEDDRKEFGPGGDKAPPSTTVAE